MPRLDIIMVEVYTQLYASGAGFGFPPRMTANPLILYHLATLAGDGKYEFTALNVFSVFKKKPNFGAPALPQTLETTQNSF